MKKTQLIEVFANIRATIVPFFSIIMFVALGIAVFLGLQWSANALASSIDDVFRKTNYHDIFVKTPVGFLDDEVDEIRGIEGVEAVETGYLCTMEATVGKSSTPLRVQSLPNTMDQPIVKQGVLPTKDNEIAIMDSWAEKNKVKVGDTLRFSDAEGIGNLKGDSYTVTARITAPDYLCKDASTYALVGSNVSGVAFVTPDAFDQDSIAFITGVPCLYVRCANTQGLSTFSDQYRQTTDAVAQKINTKSADMLTERIGTIYDTTRTAINTLKRIISTYRTAYSKLQKQQKSISEQSAANKIPKDQANKQAKAIDGQVDTLGNNFVKEAAGSCDQLGINLPNKIGNSSFANTLTELETMLDDVDGLKININGQRVAFSEIPTMLNNLKETFHKNGRNAFVLDRAHNGGIIMAKMLIDILGKLRYSMAALFVIVGLLVCYTAIARIVNDHVVQIGTKKALGLFVGEVTSGYLLYATLAVIVGALIGVLIALFVVQTIINPVLANVFLMGPYPRYFSLADSLLASVIELALILASTWLSCHRILARRTQELLSGQRPPTAKEHFFESWGAYKRLPLLGQVVVNNCVNEKRRVVATLIGVAGCTSLVVCALTLNNNVLGSMDVQYKEVYGFDAITQIDASVKDAGTSVSKRLDEQSFKNAPVYRKTCTLATNGDVALTTLFVPTDTQKFQDVYHIRSKDGATPDLSQDGVWLGSGFAYTSGLKVGDTVTISDSTGQSAEVPIAGYFNHYLTTVDAVMGADAYKRHFGSTPIANAVLVDTCGEGTNSVAKALADVKGFAGMRDDKALAARAFNMFSKLSKAVVVIYLALSALMAAIVLLNLDIMYVSEKKRELIVLMVCGYSTKDAKSYVRGDTIVLTLLGTLLGMVLGAVVGYLTVRSVEPPNVVFLHGVNVQACLIGAAVTLVFSFIAGFVAFRRIPKFDLTDLGRM